MKYFPKLAIRLLIGFSFMFFYGFYHKFLFPLTVYPSYFLINLFYDIQLVGNSFFIENSVINVVPACIAVIAYALLFLLIIFTKDLSFIKSVKIFFVGGLLILAMNVLRTVLLSVILVEFGSNLFEDVHLLFWNFVSGAYVAFVWIFLVFRFKIKEIPIYGDLKYLYKRINT